MTKRIRLLSTALIAVASATILFGCSGTADEPDCDAPVLIGAGHIGPIELGAAFPEIKAEMQTTPSFLPYSDVEGHSVAVCNSSEGILIELDENESVIAISTTSELIHTPLGGSVGMTLSELKKMHPRGTISTGIEEGGWIAFTLSEYSGYFEFSVIGVDRACLQNNADCMEQIELRRAIRYWAVE
jgi:hypothetical protein